MESALNLPPVGFINVSIGPVLISLNINLLIADPARPLQPLTGGLSRLGEIKCILFFFFSLHLWDLF